LKVSDTIISDAGNACITIEPSNGEPTVTVTVERSQLTHGQFGIFAGGGSRVTIRDSVVTNQSLFGLTPAAASGNSRLTADNCVIANSGTGVRAGTGPTFTRLSNNLIFNNSTGVDVSGGTCNSSGNNTIKGNTNDVLPAANSCTNVGTL
jgi:nitrous oxidase accessory protein NosD